MLEEQGITDLADMDADNPLASLQAASLRDGLIGNTRAGVQQG
jgi:hypothetical protein